MKQDFSLAKEELSQIGILRIVTDFYLEPKRKGNCYFVKSPATHDRTASLALYPNSNRFCDFANGGASGDCIAFVAYVKNVNQWQALKELQNFYGLTDSREQDRAETRRRIELQRQEERKKAERKQAFYVALHGEIDSLERWDVIYSTAIEKRLFEPFSDMWVFCLEEIQKIDYKLDILCASDCKAYTRMKSNADLGLSSNRYQWLLDVLIVLQEDGAFTATKGEIEEIMAQKDFELTRQPGRLGGVKLNGSEQEIKLPKLICMADVEEKEAEWLVSNYLARSCINMMAGDGGSGKTTTWCGIAAGISAGKKVFFDVVPEEFADCEPQKVLFFSSEDSVEHTLRARLRKAGANLSNILSVSLQDEFFGEIKFNSPILEGLISEVRPALVIFDPIQSFIPPEMQMGQRNAMRNCLNPLIGWGEKYGCTFLIVVHTNKRQGVFGRNRVADSADIWDISRSVLIVGQTQDGKRYLSHEKSNYGEPGATAIFDIEDGVAVLEEYSDKKDKDFVQERDFDTRQAPQRQDAERFIFDFLKNGKKPTSELDEAAKAAGISKCTLNRAKTELRKRGLLGGKSEGFGNNKAFYSYLIEKTS